MSSINDEGQVTLSALRMWSGEAVYRDFNSHIAPGTYCLTVLFYGLMGPTVAAARLLAALLTGALAMLIYLLARRCLPPLWALAPPLLFLCAGVTQWPILSYHWAAVAVFLLGTLALARWLEQPGRSAALACGASAALCGWTLQTEFGALLLTTAMLALLWRKRMTVAMIGLWLGSFAAVSLLLWAPIIVRAPVAEIWKQNVTWAVLHNGVEGRSPYSLHNLSERWEPFLAQAGPLPWSLPMLDWVLNSLSYLLVWSTDYGLFYPVLLASALLALRSEKGDAFRLLVLAQAGCALAWSHRQTLLYLNFLTPLFFILLICLLRRLGRLGALLATALFGVYAIGYLYQWREAAGFRYPIATVRGTLYSSDPAEADLMRQLFGTAARLTPPGTPAFCYPYAMGFYYLSGVKPVGPLLSVIPLLGEDEEVDRQVAVMQREKVEYIYRFPWSEQTLSTVPFIEERKFWSLVKSHDGQILEGYSPIADLRIGTLFKRKAAP
jgi:hypothetical protein